MRLLLPISCAIALTACPGARPDGPAAATPVSSAGPASPVDHGAPLEFVLDPVDRDFEHQPESQALRGKRAVVLLLASWDVGSLMALRTLGPLLNDLPKDAACLQVAVQPIGDRELVSAFMDAEKTPCRRAMGDAKRGRLGDLAQVKIIPAVLVLRADGTLAGALTGSFGLEQVRALLEKAK
ncbi:MAG: hypothetical protein HYV09_21830 [Deltaproteobacteria bacterium]|nr:hypothetical protein [Deltaproteobacteria bacterium]